MFSRRNFIKEFGSSGSPGEDNQDEWTPSQKKAFKDFMSDLNQAIHKFMVHVETCNEFAETRTANDESVSSIYTYPYAKC